MSAFENPAFQISFHHTCSDAGTRFFRPVPSHRASPCVTLRHALLRAARRDPPHRRPLNRSVGRNHGLTGSMSGRPPCRRLAWSLLPPCRKRNPLLPDTMIRAGMQRQGCRAKRFTTRATLLRLAREDPTTSADPAATWRHRDNVVGWSAHCGNNISADAYWDAILPAER